MENKIIVLVSSIAIKNNKLLIVHNKWSDDRFGWTLPCGHVEPNEKLDVAVKREFMEETGLQPLEPFKFEFLLQVKKATTMIYHFFYSITRFDGVPHVNNDPDTIITNLEYFSFSEGVSKILYEDVRFALNKWNSKETASPLFYDLTTPREHL